MSDETQELTTEQLASEAPAEGAAPETARSTDPTSETGEAEAETPTEG